MEIGSKLVSPRRLYMFDELLLLPGLAKLSPKDIDTSVELNGLKMRNPFISAPMDTVTETDMAVATAMNGSLGVIHRNCSTEEAIEMIKAVKKIKIPEEKSGLATKDSDGRLAVGAAVSTGDIEKAIAISREADLLFADVASFYNLKVIEGTKKIIKETGKKIVIGNLGTREGVLYSIKELGKENIAAIKVGMGGGSICITTDVTGVGSPVTFAVDEAARALRELKLLDQIPIIADGGIRYSRDIAFSLGLGASFAMLGNLFARCLESPGEVVRKDGKQYKVYWGMGSAEARKRRMALDRYQDSGKGKNVDEGMVMHVPLEGKAEDMINKMLAELKTTMGYVGARNVKEMREIAGIAVMKPREMKI